MHIKRQSYIKATDFQPNDIIGEVTIGSEKSPHRKLESDSMWRKIRDWILGHCLRFNLHNVPGYERINVPSIYDQLDFINFELNSQVVLRLNGS